MPGRRVFWTQKSKRQHFHYLLFRSPAATCKDQTFSSWHIFICHHAKVLSAMIFFNLIFCKLLASTLKWPACSLLWSMGLRSGLWVQNLGMLQCAIMWKDQKISSTYTCLLWWQTAALFFFPSPQAVTALLTGMEHKTEPYWQEWNTKQTQGHSRLHHCQEWNIKWTHHSIDRNGIKTLTAPLTGMEYKIASHWVTALLTRMELKREKRKRTHTLSQSQHFFIWSKLLKSNVWMS